MGETVPVKLDVTHPSFYLAEKIDLVCKDFLTNYRLSFFQYLRNYPDGSFCLITNYPAYLLDIIKNGYPIFSSYEQKHHICQNYTYLWEEALPAVYRSSAESQHSLFHGISLVKRNRDFYDVVSYATHSMSTYA